MWNSDGNLHTWSDLEFSWLINIHAGRLKVIYVCTRKKEGERNACVSHGVCNLHISTLTFNRVKGVSTRSVVLKWRTKANTMGVCAQVDAILKIVIHGHTCITNEFPTLLVHSRREALYVEFHISSDLLCKFCRRVSLSVFVYNFANAFFDIGSLRFHDNVRCFQYWKRHFQPGSSVLSLPQSNAFPWIRNMPRNFCNLESFEFWLIWPKSTFSGSFECA